MYPGYTVARYADRYLSWLTDYSRNRTTATRAPLPFLLLALVIALLTWYFIRYAAVIGLGLDVVLPVATILYVLALSSCLLADIMSVNGIGSGGRATFRIGWTMPYSSSYVARIELCINALMELG